MRSMPHMCVCASVSTACPGQLYFGSCPDGQISTRTNVPSAFQNKQPVIHRCQLTLNFLSIATAICHYDTVSRAPTPQTHAQMLACTHTCTNTHTQDKVLSYLTINIELKPCITNTHAYTNTQPGVQNKQGLTI